MDTLTLRRPDDWHLHVRDNDALASVVPHTATQFARAIIMPNLKPPVTTTEQALAYRERILASVPEGMPFIPLMTLYLTNETSAEEIRKAHQSGAITGIKLYPAGATTHSDAGVTDITKTFDTLAAMEEIGLPLLVHGEVTDPDVDVFDREQVFIDRQLIPVVTQFPKLRLVLEHLSTHHGVDFVNQGDDNIAGTITAHHLLMNRNAMFSGGIRTHHYCLPVLKRESHRQALIAAATSDNGKFFLGTDSAPHPKGLKQSACGCAGIYTAHAAMELYAEAFEQAGCLDRLEGFASLHGPAFYGLPVNEDTITLKKQTWQVPDSYPMGDDTVVPLRAGESISWKLIKPIRK
ncbi:MAG: dihydroorotase [Gammaproteobacteria bacterium]|nr:MAG: dihydroorotase [Gammaproteobacteria bacterium]